MKSFLKNLFKTKLEKSKENLEQLMASGNFVEAAKIMNAANYKINFSNIFKKFSEAFDEALAEDDKIPDSDKLGVFITFMRNGLIITPRMIPYIVANTQNPWHVFETLDLALRQGQKLKNLIDEKGLGGTTLLELSTWNRNDRSMFFKIDVTTYLAQKGAVMTVAALNNILKETKKDLPAKKELRWGREDVRTEGWKLPQVEKVFQYLMQDPEELTAMLRECEILITKKFGEDGFKSLLAAAELPRKEKKSSKRESEVEASVKENSTQKKEGEPPSTNPENVHFAGNNSKNFSQGNRDKNGAMLY